MKFRRVWQRHGRRRW